MKTETLVPVFWRRAAFGAGPERSSIFTATVGVAHLEVRHRRGALVWEWSVMCEGWSPRKGWSASLDLAKQVAVSVVVEQTPVVL